MKFFALILVVALVQTIKCDEIINATTMETLRQDLRMGYSLKERELDIQTKVKTRIAIHHVGVSELESKIQIFGRIKWNWVDDKLRWNVSQYENIAEVVMDEWHFWTPILELENQVNNHKDNGFSMAQLRVSSNGTASQEKNFQLTTFCTMSFKYWPFDRHFCRFNFEPTGNPGIQYALKVNLGNGLDEELINSDWKVVASVFGTEDFDEEGAEAGIKMYLHIDRRPGGYWTMIFAPATVIIILTLIGFWLPVQAGEKILLNGIVGIILNLYLLYFSQKLPTMGMHTPLVVQFCSFSLYMVMTSMVISIVVLGISRTKHSYGTPSAVKRFLESKVGQWLLLKNLFSTPSGNAVPDEGTEVSTSFDVRMFQDEDEEGGNAGEEEDMEPSIRRSRPSVINKGNLRSSVQQDWIQLATAIDRLAFLVYSLIFIVIAIVYGV